MDTFSPCFDPKRLSSIEIASSPPRICAQFPGVTTVQFSQWHLCATYSWYGTYPLGVNAARATALNRAVCLPHLRRPLHSTRFWIPARFKTCFIEWRMRLLRKDWARLGTASAGCILVCNSGTVAAEPIRACRATFPAQLPVGVERAPECSARCLLRR